MSNLNIGQTCDALHVDLFKRMCLMSNNEQMNSSIHTYITLLLDHKCLILSFLITQHGRIVCCSLQLKLPTLTA